MRWIIIYRYPDADEECFTACRSLISALWWVLLHGRKLAHISICPAKYFNDLRDFPIDRCPHCNGQAEYRAFKKYDGHFAYEAGAVVCTKCGAQTKEEVTSGYYGIAVSPEAIIQKWNRRCGR